MPHFVPSLKQNINSNYINQTYVQRQLKLSSWTGNPMSQRHHKFTENAFRPVHVNPRRHPTSLPESNDTHQQKKKKNEYLPPQNVGPSHPRPPIRVIPDFRVQQPLNFSEPRPHAGTYVEHTQHIGQIAFAYRPPRRRQLKLAPPRGAGEGGLRAARAFLLDTAARSRRWLCTGDGSYELAAVVAFRVFGVAVEISRWFVGNNLDRVGLPFIVSKNQLLFSVMMNVFGTYMFHLNASLRDNESRVRDEIFFLLRTLDDGFAIVFVIGDPEKARTQMFPKISTVFHFEFWKVDSELVIGLLRKPRRNGRHCMLGFTSRSIHWCTLLHSSNINGLFDKGFEIKTHGNDMFVPYPYSNSTLYC